MGEFVCELADRRGGVAARFAISNLLAYESYDYLFHRLFPPFASTVAFELGLSAPELSGPTGRPQASAAVHGLDPFLTYAHVGSADANEGGCWTNEMRASFGYARRAAVFTASDVAGGGHVATATAEFPNAHEWTPQDGADWNDDSTPVAIEQPPPEWFGGVYPDPIVGFPWQYPRKLAGDVGSTLAYMKAWDASGSLDWLWDFRRMGGFPITCAWIVRPFDAKLVAVGLFRRPVLLWPGMTLHVSYRGRFEPVTNVVAGEFLRHAAATCFAGGATFDRLYGRPVLTTFTPSWRASYADLVPHFPAIAHVDLGNWTVVAAVETPPAAAYAKTAVETTWTNDSGAEIAGIGYIAVYGETGATRTLCFVAPLAAPVTLANGDTLRADGGVRFDFASV